MLLKTCLKCSDGYLGHFKAILFFNWSIPLSDPRIVSDPQDLMARMVPSEMDLPQVRVELVGSSSSALEKREEEEVRMRSIGARRICAMLSRRSSRRSSNGSPLRRSCGVGSSPYMRSCGLRSSPLRGCGMGSSPLRSCGVGSSPYIRSCGIGIGLTSSPINLLGVERGGAVQRRALIPSPRFIYLLLKRKEKF